MLAEREAFEKGAKWDAAKRGMMNPIQSAKGVANRLGDANERRKARGEFNQLGATAQASFGGDADAYANQISDKRRKGRETEQLDAMNAKVGNPLPAAAAPAAGAPAPAAGAPAPAAGAAPAGGAPAPAAGAAPAGGAPAGGAPAGGAGAGAAPAGGAGAGGAGAAPAPAAGAAPAGGAPAAAPAAAPANNMQQMAQNMAFGADAQAIQAGKGGEKQSWMKDRSFGGKVADVLSMGLTSGMG